MALSRKKKEEIVAHMTDTLRSAKAVVFVSFQGLSVADAAEMRTALRENNVRYTVVKKTLLARALDAAGITGERPELTGEISVAYPEKTEGDVEVAPAKGIAEFMKKFEERIIPLGGILEGVYISKEETLALSRVLPRQMLYVQLATLLNSPIQQTAGVLSGVMRSFAVALGQIAETKTSA